MVPVHSWRKFSAVFGTTSLLSCSQQHCIARVHQSMRAVEACSRRSLSYLELQTPSLLTTDTAAHAQDQR